MATYYIRFTTSMPIEEVFDFFNSPEHVAAVADSYPFGKPKLYPYSSLPTVQKGSGMPYQIQYDIGRTRYVYEVVTLVSTRPTYLYQEQIPVGVGPVGLGFFELEKYPTDRREEWKAVQAYQTFYHFELEQLADQRTRVQMETTYVAKNWWMQIWAWITVFLIQGRMFYYGWQLRKLLDKRYQKGQSLS